MTKVPFAERLKEILRIRDMSAADLSRATGISEAVISQYKKGLYEPKQDRLELLSTVLNVAPGWLMGYEVPMNHPDTSDGGGWAGSGYYYQFDSPSGMSIADEEMIEEGKTIAPAHGEQGRDGFEPSYGDLDRLKFALFGGDSIEGIDDELMEDVKAYAKFKLQQKQKEKEKDK